MFHGPEGRYDTRVKKIQERLLCQSKKTQTEPCSVKKGLNAFSESTDSYQPAQGRYGQKLLADLKFYTC